MNSSNHEYKTGYRITNLKILKHYMNMKNYLIIAASALALASCSSEDFVGTEGGNVETSANKAINFSGNAGKITRATTSNTGTPQAMLGYQFKVYGVKKMSKNGGDKFEPSFSDYYVWYDEAKNTTSNTNGWEYVGNKKAGNEDATYGTGNIKLQNDQYIKYWDYAAEEYHFVAGSPISAFTYNKNADINTVGMKIPSATITGLAGHININKTETALKTDPVYVATPIVVKKEKYQKPVTFEFNRQQAMVRVGIYETIPGYSITEINFYGADGKVQSIKEADGKESKGTNIILTSSTENYFVGGSNVSGTITYDWSGETPSYTYTYSDANLTKSKNWYAGKMETLATTSTAEVATLYGKDADMSTNGYFTVLPTPSATTAAPIIIKCDYTLNADDLSGETIKVTGATAAIPAAFSKWEVNTRYTYLFKISQNTNGYTGDDPNKVGLYPITFDAAVKESTEATPEGTVTTVSTPSITTYQKGSVTDASVEYKTGEAIYATATDKDGNENTLTINGTAVGNVQVYKLSKERTEAELQVSAIVNEEFKDENKVTTTVSTTNTTVGNVTLEANKYLSFTPEKAGFYAIQYLVKAAEGSTPAVYAYKVVYVKAAKK